MFLFSLQSELLLAQGGGVYILSGTVNFLTCQITSNTAGYVSDRILNLQGTFVQRPVEGDVSELTLYVVGVE